MAILLEWDPPSGLFAGTEAAQFHYRVRATPDASSSWSDANDQVSEISSVGH
jgi:hypothetical protein